MAFFTSTDQTITAAGTLTLAHGLGAVPKLVHIYLVCQTANNGFAVGNVVAPRECGFNANTSGGGIGCVAKVDSTNVFIVFGSKSGTFQLNSNATGAVGNSFFINNSDWKLRVVAEA
jgi:hypothetical protein